MPRWTPEQEARLRELWAQPSTVASVAAEFRLTVRAVSHHAYRLGLPVKTPVRRPEAEDILLREQWMAGVPLRKIARDLGLCHHAVSRRAARLGLPTRARKAPPPHDDDRLRMMWGEGASLADIGRAFGITDSAAHRRAMRLGLPRRPIKPPVNSGGPTVWTPERDALLRALWPTGMLRDAIAEQIGVTMQSVASRIVRLKLPPRRSHQLWSGEQDTILRDHWQTHTNSQLVALTGMTLKSVRNRAKTLDLPPRPPERRKPPIRKPKKVGTVAPKAKSVRKRVVETVFVQPRAVTEFHDCGSAADKLDSRLSRARGALAAGRDPSAVAHQFNLPLREAYRLAGELRAA